MSNGGYNPAVTNPTQTAKQQMKSNSVPFFFGGSQVENALGYIPKIPVQTPKLITFKKGKGKK
jgi:hypothetical protein